MTTKTDKQERAELLPCPFCGSADIHIAPDEVGSGGQWVGPVHIVCGGDCVAGQTGDDKESAVAAWNRRAALQSQDREDSARLDWIERNARRDPDMGGNHTWWPTSFNKTIRGPSLRDAIDHARRIEGDGK